MPVTQSFQDWLQIREMQEDKIYFTDGRVVQILKVSPVNFKLKSPLEQEAIFQSYQRLLKLFHSQIQILVLSKKTDVSQHLEEVQKNTKEDSPFYEMSQDYIQLVKQFVRQKKTMTKGFYLVLPVTATSEVELTKWIEGFERCGNRVERCCKAQLILLLQQFTNKRCLSLS